MRYYLNVGSNLGNRHAHLRHAVRQLALVGVVRRLSPVVYTPAWGFDSPHRFANQGVLLDSPLDPFTLLDSLHDIEQLLGSGPHRTARGGYADRVVDIDIMAAEHDDGSPVVIDTPELTIPHRHLNERPFFTGPLQALRDGAR